jgi:hypothetical protein
MYLNVVQASKKIHVNVGQISKLFFMFCVKPALWIDGVPFYTLRQIKIIKNHYECIVKNSLNLSESEEEIEFKVKNSKYYRQRRKDAITTQRN